MVVEKIFSAKFDYKVYNSKRQRFFKVKTHFERARKKESFEKLNK